MADANANKGKSKKAPTMEELTALKAAHDAAVKAHDERETEVKTEADEAYNAIVKENADELAELETAVTAAEEAFTTAMKKAGLAS